MALFFYGFSTALACALGFAVAQAWIRDHRAGVWSARAATSVAALAIALGLALGWCVTSYFQWYTLMATQR